MRYVVGHVPDTDPLSMGTSTESSDNNIDTSRGSSDSEVIFYFKEKPEEDSDLSDDAPSRKKTKKV